MPATTLYKAKLGAALAVATLASLAQVMPTQAMAADVAPYVTPSSYRWQGAYVGANLGYQWGGVSRSGADPSGAAGGLQAGYNWQFGQFVFGAETDFQASAATDRFAPWKFSNPWFGTVRARTGVAMDNVMFYGTLGLAYGTLKAQSTTFGVTESRTGAGWSGGAGLEVALAGNWTARAEYLYVNLDERPFVLDGTTHGIVSNLLRIGVNYRF
jgi:outer membrane immunogenic protein